MAQITHKIEFLVNAAEPIPEIASVISTLLQMHPGREAEILSAVKAEVAAALLSYQESEKSEKGEVTE